MFFSSRLVVFLAAVITILCGAGRALLHEKSTFADADPLALHMRFEPRSFGDRDSMTRKAGVARRFEAKSDIIEDLAARRITFMEAAAKFGKLNEEPPVAKWSVLRICNPACSDNEILCRQVILFAKSLLRNRSALVKAEVALSKPSWRSVSRKAR